MVPPGGRAAPSRSRTSVSEMRWGLLSLFLQDIFTAVRLHHSKTSRQGKRAGCPSMGPWWCLGQLQSVVWTSQLGLTVKNPPANAGDTRDGGLIPGSGRSPGEENDNPLQYSCLENLMDRGAWWPAVHRVSKSQTLSDLAHMHISCLQK